MAFADWTWSSPNPLRVADPTGLLTGQVGKWLANTAYWGSVNNEFNGGAAWSANDYRIEFKHVFSGVGTDMGNNILILARATNFVSGIPQDCYRVAYKIDTARITIDRIVSNTLTNLIDVGGWTGIRNRGVLKIFAMRVTGVNPVHLEAFFDDAFVTDYWDGDGARIATGKVGCAVASTGSEVDAYIDDFKITRT